MTNIFCLEEWEQFIKEERPSLDCVRYVNRNSLYKCYSTANERYIAVYRTDENGILERVELYFPSEFCYDNFCSEPIDSYDLYRLSVNYKNIMV